MLTSYAGYTDLYIKEKTYKVIKSLHICMFRFVYSSQLSMLLDARVLQVKALIDRDEVGPCGIREEHPQL